MKIISFSLLLLMLSVSTLGQTFTISFNPNDFSYNYDDLLIISTNLKERCVIGDTLSPNLPFFPYRIKVPANTNNASLSIQYDKSQIAENVRLAANPKPSIRDNRVNQESVLRESSHSVEMPIINAGVKHQNGVSYLLLYATPFLYDHQLRKLYFVSDIHIELTDLPSNLNTTPSSLLEILSTPSEFNTQEDSQQPRTVNDSIDYLIITNNNLKSSFNGLVQWKQKKCLRCKIVTKEEIDTLYPQYTDACARIKAYILDYSSPTRKKWVLIGGDDFIIPSKLCYGAGHYTLSDLYYATGSGYADLNWNTNNNGWDGDVQDSISFEPCVYLSRLPVRTAQQVQDYTEKLIDYEMGVSINDNMLLAGYKLNNIYGTKSDSHLLNEEVFDEFVPDYWNGDLDYIYDTGSSFNFYINGNNLRDVIDDNQYNVIHEISHGDNNLWCVSNNSYTYYYNSHAQTQTNYPGSVIVTGACYTNAFEWEPCLSESLLRNSDGGAVAYFGSSGPGFGGENYGNSTYVPLMYSDQYDGHFLQNLHTGIPVDNPYSLAALATEAKSTVFNEFHGIDNSDIYRFLLMSINIMGDPEMQIWTSTPQNLSSNPMVVDPYVGVSLTGNVVVGTSVSGCTIAALDENGIRLVKKNTNSANFEGLSGETNIIILKHNYIPYMKTIYVDDWGGGGNEPQPLFVHASQIGDNTIEVGLVENADSSPTTSMDVSQGWTLKVVNTITGEIKYSQLVEDDFCRINTTGWTPSIYGIHVSMNGRSAHVKVNIR